ncbi:required for drug-induced death protein 1-like [Phyllopteryx taeniolatus]|uniref:required for drug-induced death protein 1-like n=1 Tax=Phyllopteryx taeniolatus TaxID=161469 RepID=UPI002AD2D272|nr:required for drug-induced death protein 1-like [Phyllopteryx taeniolatus]
MKPKGAPPRRPRHRDAEAGAAPYRRHVERAEAEQRPHRQPKGVRLAFRADRYQPLDEQEVKEEKKTGKEKYKKVQKNVGKALRSTWTCLMLGLYHFALGYSAPITVVATFVPDFSPAWNRT